MKKWLLLSTFIACLIGGLPLQAEETEAVKGEKIYLSPERIKVLVEGIFFLTDLGEYQLARLVSSDEGGLYVVSAYIRCPACGAWSTDGSIHKLWCPYSK